MPHEVFHYPTLDALRARAAELAAWLPLSDDLSPLLSPLSLAGGYALPNRLALQPMEGSDGTAEGGPGPLTARRYERFARGGAGLIWFEAVATAPDARASAHQLYLTEETLPAFQRLVARIREIGVQANGFAPLIIMQATHSGRYAKPRGVPEPIIAYNNPLFEKDNPIDPARIVTDDALERYEARFEATARLARRAGFDGMDVKCCHRYLASELMSAYDRPGRYGGDFTNRSRFVLNSFRAARAGGGADFLLTSRMNAHDGYPYPYGFGVAQDVGRGGRAGAMLPADTAALPVAPPFPDLTEAKMLARAFVSLGAPLLDVTIGNPYTNPHVNRPYDKGNYVPDEHPLTGVSRMMRCVAEVQSAVPDTPVIGSAFSYLRALSPHLAAGMIAGGHCGIAGFGRMAFANPDFPNQIKEDGKIDERRVCVCCGQCAQMLRHGGPAGCAVRDREAYTV